MKRKINIPDDYFNDSEFLIESADDNLVIGILGSHPTSEQILKYELCSSIGYYINKNNLSLTAVEKMTGVNASDISRIKNKHIDRFTVDRLIKLYSVLDCDKNIQIILKNASLKMSRLVS